MKILFYSHSWWPNIGGVEDIGHCVADGLALRGHEVTVVTPVSSSTERETNYAIVRAPDDARLRELVRESDIVHSNGITLKLLPMAVWRGKPFTWTYHGYQLQCIDGAGWINGQPSPMEPWASIGAYRKAFGLKSAITGGIKLWLRRLGSKLVSANIASSKHLAVRQPAPRLVICFNPYDRRLFVPVNMAQAKECLSNSDATFTFIGRLVTEKGVDDLLCAFAQLVQRDMDSSGSSPATLKVIGDGPEAQPLRELASQLQISSQVNWCGSRVGSELTEAITKSGICIMPSAWEEPGALTVLGLMAAGKPLIVSEKGWLSEAAEGACLTFPNGDRQALAVQMDKLRKDKQLQLQLIERALKRIEEYEPEGCIDHYEQVFALIVRGEAP